MGSRGTETRFLKNRASSFLRHKLRHKVAGQNPQHFAFDGRGQRWTPFVNFGKAKPMQAQDNVFNALGNAADEQADGLFAYWGVGNGRFEQLRHGKGAAE